MSEQYLIEKETLTATADAIRLYTTPVGENTHGFIREYYDDYSSIVRCFFEEYDSLGDPFLGTSWAMGQFMGVGYEHNSDGVRVPVLYSETGVGQDVDTYYYVGPERIGDTIYDKWQKIEYHDDDYYDPDSLYASWDGQLQSFCYTNKVIELIKDEDSLISPIDFPEKIEAVYQAGAIAGGGGVDLSLATATSGQILQGYTAYTEDGLISGAIPNYNGGTSVTPKNGSITLPTAGKFCPTNIVVKGDVDLKAENIKKGVELFGVTGTLATEVKTRVLTLTGDEYGEFSLSALGDVKAWFLSVPNRIGTSAKIQIGLRQDYTPILSSTATIYEIQMSCINDLCMQDYTVGSSNEVSGYTKLTAVPNRIIVTQSTVDASDQSLATSIVLTYVV